jgi:hypothetical protein
MPKKPARKLLPINCLINKATIKATMAILHHGKNSPAIKLNKAVSIVAKKNLMLQF